ncbi:MAG: ATP-binding protein [Trueperaceae bacterium]|nr:ATP-binding protein [Trueperaceae bacterium]
MTLSSEQLQPIFSEEEEQQRLDALRRYDIFDTETEEVFDRITRIASRIFAAPIVLISLIDVNRQWFKSCYGLDVRETDRKLSFCVHAMRIDDVLVVPDATRDPRFVDNGLVTGEPYIRFYAGAPLKSSEGVNIGSLCVIDTVPRDGISDEERENLRDLAAVVIDELELRVSQRTALEAEEEVRRAEQRTRTLIENVPGVIFTLSLEGEVTFVSPGFESLLGYDADVGLDRFGTLLADSEEASKARAIITQANEGKTVWEQLWVQHADGHDLLLEMVIGPNDRVGERIGLVGFAHDVTERERAKRDLAKQQERMRLLYEVTARPTRNYSDWIGEALALTTRLLNLDVGIVSCIRDNVFTVAHVYGAETDPQQGEEFALGNTFCDITLSRGQVTTIDHATASGHHRHPCYEATEMESYIGVPLVVDGRVDGTLGFLGKKPRDTPFTKSDRDFVELLSRWVGSVIERKRARNQERRHLSELEYKNEQLEQASRLKSEFLANMSHELRTPLTAVLGFSEVLEEEMFGPLNDQQKQYIHDIYESGKHLLSLINDVLDVSKIEAGKMEMGLEPVDLTDLAQDALRLVRERSERRGISLETDLPDTIAPLSADPRKLKQALLNYLSNAIKFTDEGGTVTLRIRDDAEHVSVEVEDTGIGIAPEDQQRLFKPFVQLDASLARQYEGTGLGLLLTRRLVELHGGTVWVDSEPGQGSVFGMRLPRSAQR